MTSHVQCFLLFSIFISILLAFILYRKIRKKILRKERKRFAIMRAQQIEETNQAINNLKLSSSFSLTNRSESIANKIPWSEFDDFHSGRFHFEPVSQNNLINNIKFALAENNQDNLYKYLTQIDGAGDRRKIKNKKIIRGNRIKIGFFCNYMNSGIFRNTVGIYNNFFDKIQWVGCYINADYIITGSSCPIINFPTSEVALDYANENFDFIIDADFLLRPSNFYEILRNTSCHTLNYYNFSCSSYNNHLDAFLVTDLIKPCKYPPSERLIALPAQGSWHMKEQTNFHHTYLYDIVLIGDQFKYGKNFLNTYRSLSEEFKILFLGLRDEEYLIKPLKQYGWNMKNIEFKQGIYDEEQFRYFLTKTKVTLDTLDYSGGSSTLYSLRSGTPVLTIKGEYLIDGMTSAMLKEMGLSELIFNDSEEIKKFLKSKTIEEFKEYSRYVAKKTSDSLYFKPQEFLPIFYDKLIEAFEVK